MRKMWSSKRESSDKVELIDSAYGVKPSSSSAPAYPQPAATYNGLAPLSGLRTGQDMGPVSDRFRVLRAKNFKGLARFKLPKGALRLYIDDLYHTLLNMPRYRFLASFFCVYLTLYLFFSFFYLAISEECIGVEMTFAHAFWFSVWTASTIGYSGDMAPSPDCAGVNMLLMIQLIVAALVDTMLMSLVFSRFAAPLPRAKTIRFSTHAVLARPPGAKYWTLSFRLANIRKHALMEPQVMLLLATPNHQPGSSGMRFIPLAVDDEITQVTSLKLGLPVTVSHTITPASPMWDLSLSVMEENAMEFVCFMSGLDPMTSNMVQAHHSYRPVDVRMNEQFVAIHISTNKMGRLGVDLSVIDETSVAEVGMGPRDESRQVLYPVSVEEGGSREGIRQHMEDLRHHTIHSLTDPHGQDDADNEDGSAAGGAIMQAGAIVPVNGRAGGSVGAAGSSAGWQHPLEAAAAPQLPVSRSAGDGGLSAPPLGSGSTQQWDAAVRALCEAVGGDASASAAVRQQAAALKAALVAVPAPQAGHQRSVSAVTLTAAGQQQQQSGAGTSLL